MACPVCSTYGSAVLMAYRNGDKCPTCDLPAEAAHQVMAAQQRHADAELTKRYATAATELERARRENSQMKDALGEIVGHLDYLKEVGIIK